MNERIQEILKEILKNGSFGTDEFELQEEFLLSRLTSFRTGGPATVLFPKTERVLVHLIPRLVKESVPYFILGCASNVIALDEGYRGLVISLTKLKSVEVTEEEIFASAGVSITYLATVAKKHALTGMEFFYGIPGSVGGAVFMNAGAYGGECKDILKEVTFLTREGEVKTASAEELEMGYRTSVFEKNGAVILSALFSLKRGDEGEIDRRMEELMAKRVEKQPLEYPSAGSTFKRYPGRYTAQMIDEAGLKGYRIGGAQVSEKHAGFVINCGDAKSAHILELIDHIKKVILEKEGISIECEVRLIV